MASTVPFARAMNVVSFPPVRLTGVAKLRPPSADTAIASKERPSAPVPPTRR
ncbi:MAG TPA: hypothetical protein VIQ54_06115 [Polyangia bacterium]